MAELTPAVVGYTGGRFSGSHFAAIAWLRWRILANSFRRKGGTAELIGRILLLPLLAVLVLLPATLAGFFAWFVAMHGTLEHISLVLWGTFGLTQLLNLNLGQPGTTFDPTELIRFPMRLQNYVLVRLCFGLLSPGNVVVTLMSAAIFVGISIDRPRLWPWTLLATAAFALANVLFSRMIFAWIDRWLSTRRTRELFTGLIFATSLGFQYLNVRFNPGFQRGRRSPATPHDLLRAEHFYHQLHRWLQWLPPELTGSAIVAGQRGLPFDAVLNIALVLVYAATFLAVYTLRMRAEYHGENLGDVANAVQAFPRAPALPPQAPLAFSPPVFGPLPRNPVWPPSLRPLLAKELLMLRRNTGLLYGVVAPTVMVFLFAGRLSLRGGSPWILLLAVGYALLGLAPMSYNSFGLEGPGAQFYFIAPVPLREVFLAKNVMHFAVAFLEVCTVVGIVCYTAGRPRIGDALFVLLWALATLLTTTALGNLRSIAAPRKINPGRSLHRAQSPLSAWMAIGVLVACAGIGAGLQGLIVFLHERWLGLGLMALLATGALVAYGQGLRHIEAYALQRRDSLFEELGKKT